MTTVTQPKYNIQTAFNRFWEVFVVGKAKQSRRPSALKSLPACLYNNSINGYGCAIGCCIVDQTIAKSWDDLGSVVAIPAIELERIFTDARDKGIVYWRLQQLHDHDSYWNEDGTIDSEQVIAFAQEHKLTVPV